MLKVNTSAVLFSLGMIFAGASEAAEVKYQPIDDAEFLSKMCSDENRPFLQDMDKNWSTLYKFKTDDQRDTFDRTIRPAMVNSCVAYMAINSVDYSKVEGDGVDYSRNDKAMEKWFAGYKDKLHSQLKELQALPKVQEQHRKEMTQREAGKKIAVEEARQEDPMVGIRRANSEESAKDAAYCAGVFGQLSTKEAGLTGATLKGVQNGFVAFSAMSGLIDSPVDRNYSLERGAREARESVSSHDARRLASIRDYCKLAGANFQMRVNNKAIDMVKQDKK